MRISDWSSDVCSSDLGTTWPAGRLRRPLLICRALRRRLAERQEERFMDDDSRLGHFEQELSAIIGDALARELVVYAHRPNPLERSEGRRVGKGGGRPCRFGWAPYH